MIIKKTKRGVCKVCLSKNIKVNTLRLCTHCAYKFSTSDNRASDIQGIRQDMIEFGVPLKGQSTYNERKLYGNWDDDSDY